LRIWNNPLLTNLEGLDNLSSIDGNLGIDLNETLVSLEGLDNLNSVGGGLYIFQNFTLNNIENLIALNSIGGGLYIGSNALTNLTGLDNIESLGGDLSIGGSQHLESLSGLENIVSISGKLSIGENELLTNLDALSKLTTVGGGIVINFNDNITSLNGLHNIQSMDGNLFIAENDLLNDISALHNITTVNGVLNIANNNALENLTGLENITAINGYLCIKGNHNLENIEGIQNIDATTIESQKQYRRDLEILYNNNLSQCAVQSVCDFLDLEGKTVLIKSNNEDCNSVQEVKEQCPPAPICTNILSPENGEIDVEINTEITWEFIDDADGYKLSIGTTIGGNDILDNEDMGNYNYYFPENLPCGTEIFVLVTSYNTEGIETQCNSDYSFTTEDVYGYAGNNVYTCEGESVEIFATGGTTYSWTPIEGLDDPNVDSPTANVYETTTFTVTISNEGRCPYIDSLTVFVNPKPKTEFNVKSESAFEANDGFAVAKPVGGLSPFTYDWSNGSINDSINNLSPGKYFITITDANGCSVMDSVNIDKYICPNLMVESDIKDVLCYNSCTGSIKIKKVDNSVGAISYIWSDSTTASSIENLCDGKYFVEIVDSKNCTVKDSFIVKEPLELIANIVATDETGTDFNDGTAEVVISGGTSPYTYLWSNGEITKKIKNLSPGTYKVVATDSNGCSIEKEVEVKKHDAVILGLNVEINNVSCFGESDGSIEIKDVANAVLPITINWNNGSDTKKIDGLKAGVYEVEITDVENNTVTKEFVISQPDEILISLVSSKNIENGEPGSIEISTNDVGNYTYSWTGPNGFIANSENLENLTNSGCYNLIVTEIVTGCMKEDTFCIETITGTKDISSNNIKLYPNPANDMLMIDFSNQEAREANISIFNLEGKEILKRLKTTKQKVVIVDVKFIMEGIYFVKIFQKDNVLIKKILINR